MIQKKQIDDCISVARKFGATRVIIFGSAAEEPSKARDIDLLTAGVEGMDFFTMGAEMEERSGAQVDVFPYSQSNPFAVHAEKYGRIVYDKATA